MQTEEFAKKMSDIHARKVAALDALVAPARAACNAMQDANMKRTADPLSEALFQVDAIGQEISALIKEDGAMDAFIDLLSRRK